MLLTNLTALKLIILLQSFITIHGTPIIYQESEAAIRYAKSVEMRQYMNQSMDPCDDFYEFACGNWHIIHPPTLETKQTVYFHQASYDYMDKLSAVLEVSDSDDSVLLRNIKNFYTSCLNVSPTRSIYRENLLRIIDEFGKMPVLEGDTWRSEDFDWLQTVGDIAYKLNKRIFLDFDVISDQYDNKLKILELRPFTFPLENVALYLDDANEEYRRIHRRDITDNLVAFLDVDPEVATKTAEDIVALEIRLAKGAQLQLGYGASASDVTTIDKLYNKYYDRLDIKRLLKLSIGSIPKLPVVERLPSYQDNLIVVMNSVEKDKIANYIFYYLLRDFMVTVPKPGKSLKKICINKTRKFFYFYLENIMYHKLNLQQAEINVRNMFADMRSIFHSALASDTYPWISNDTLTKAIEKLKAMTIQIDSYNDLDFYTVYGDLSMSQQDIMDNLRKIFAQQGVQARASLNTTSTVLEETDVLYGPAYDIKENRIIIPVASMLPHYFWSRSFPTAINFGQLGSQIAHEMIHGFDNVGRYFDKQGNRLQWWDVNSSNNFTLRSQCFVDQYKRYEFGGKLLPENRDQAENIADNGGVRLAYETYTSWYNSPWNSSDDTNPETLPEMEFSGPQIFFIAFAQQWCSETHPYYKSLQVITDRHTPANFRVIGTLSNMQGFSAAFQCPSGTGMNPLNKCQIY